jgi:DNA-directed RNA polymerase omega subunit
MNGFAKSLNLLEVADSMAVLNQAPDSQFAFVVVAGKRARQLMLGAVPLVANPRSHKATRVAMEELNAGQLEYRTPDLDGADKDGKRRKD